MAEPFSSRMISPRSGRDTLPAQMEARYGIPVAQLTELDLGVYRVGRRDGPDWVARVFAADRPLAAAEGDAALLRRLEQQEFPAERCAVPEPVFVHEGQGVLVTRYVAGTRADGSQQTFGRLGGLLGRLHRLPGDHARAGGGWHHLIHQGSPAAEIAAARSRLEASAPGLPADQQPLLAALLAELDRADGCADLPHALIHPDFGPANAILAPDDGLVLVDWTGAGRGPRLYSLAFLLWAAGCGGPSRLDAAVAGYREHVTPGDNEIGRLAGAICARPLILACWMVLAGRKGLAETVGELAAGRELAGSFAARAASAFRAAPGSWLGLTMTTREASSFEGTRLRALRQSQAPDDPAGWLGARGWAAQITGPRAVLRAHGRPAPEQARPEQPQAGQPQAGQPQAGRPQPEQIPADQEDAARPKALLIRATLDQRRDTAGKPAGESAGGAPAPGRRGAAPARQARKPGRRDQRETVLVAEIRFSALLSQALVAFTIEFDNESEHQLPHRTTWGPAAHSGRGPWLVSLAMWADFMQFLPPAGVPLRAVADLVPLTNLAGLERWGYVTVGPDPADRRPAPPRRDHVVRPTRWGRQAQQIWAPLTGVISERWRERFGAAAVDRLAGALRALISPPADGWPPFLPVSCVQAAGVQPAGAGLDQPALSPEHRVASSDLATLMARALMSFRAEFESESAVPLPVSANVLRVLSAGGVALRQVPRRAGISKEAVSVSAGWLERRGYVVNEPDPAGGRGRQVRLTPRGEQAQDDYYRLADRIGSGWRVRSGDGVIDGLTVALRALYAQPDGDGQPLIGAGLVPYPDGWRAHPPYQRLTEAMITDPAGALPHYPMVSHRGGYPDGS